MNIRMKNSILSYCFSFYVLDLELPSRLMIWNQRKTFIVKKVNCQLEFILK